MKFVVLLGIVSLLADITYEGARSIMGPFLAVLGASGTIVGVVAGLGELIGYAMRLLSGYLSDKTQRYWSITFIGYFINQLAVPLLALTGSWPIASALIVTERFGKAIRSPARDALLSYATNQIGRGRGFGIHNALDQTGAVCGPLLVATIIFFTGSYRTSFAWLAIPAVLALFTLMFSMLSFPNPRSMEISETAPQSEKFTKTYYLFIAATSLLAVGYVDFALIAFHFQKSNLTTEAWIPIFYSGAMAAQGFSSFLFGSLFDRKGLIVLTLVMGTASLFSPLVFLGNEGMATIGALLWGIGMGTQGTIMRAVTAQMIHISKRGTAYGILNMSFGISWFIGSAIMGILYDISIPYVVTFSMLFQLAALPILCWISYQKQD